MFHVKEMYEKFYKESLKGGIKRPSKNNISQGKRQTKKV